MRKLFLFLSILIGALAFAPAQAAITPTPAQILDICPDNPKAKACPGAAEWFLSSRPPSETSDAQIVSLAVKIVEDLEANNYPLPVCLDAADGLRVLAKGMINGQRAEQLAEIADTLCLDTETAAIGRPNGPPGPPPSIHPGGNGNGPNCPPGPRGGQPPRGDCGPVDCDEGQHEEGGVCVPDDPTCTGGKEFNGETCECPAGTEEEEGQCVTPDPVCTGGKEFNGETCECPAGTEEEEGQCVTPDPVCTGGKEFNGETCECPAGTEEEEGQCVTPDPVCTGGKEFNGETCECPAGTEEEEGQCVTPDPVCTGGKEFNGETCECPSDKIEVDGVCKDPHALCTTGHEWSTELGQCVCPAGKTEVDGVCKTVPDVCTGGSSWDEEEEACLCPEGKEMVDGVCKTIPAVCTGGSSWDEEEESCLCPEGKKMDDQGVCQPIVCADLYHLEGSTCVPDTSICINPAGHILPVTSQACDRGQGYKICSLVNAAVNSATCPPVNGICGDGGTLSQDGKSCVEEEEEDPPTVCTPGSLGCPPINPPTGPSYCTSPLVIVNNQGTKTCQMPAP